MATTDGASVPRPRRQSGQRPSTYLRQVVALLLDPQLLASDGHSCYPPDVVAKARRLLGDFPGSSIGSYTHTGGQLPVRRVCAEFLSRRDGAPARVQDVHVTCGSVEAIRLLLEGFGRRRPKSTGILVPAPGCRLYAGFARQVGALPTPYRLGGPEIGWQLIETELELAYQTAIDSGSEPRVLVLINPGSPAGQLLTESSLAMAAEFALRRGLFVISDETLQLATFSGHFVAFRQVALNRFGPRLEVATVASLSKGLLGGEAGMRVGFCELLNLHPAASAGLLAVLACTSCPPVIGQAALAAALTPPEPGEASHAAHAAEVAGAAAALGRRAALAGDFFASLPAWQPGGLVAPCAGTWVYPRLPLPPGLICNANEAAADELFCRELARRAGGAVAEPGGAAFGQPPGDGFFYFRLSIQSSDESLLADLKLIKEVYLEFLERYAA